MIEEIHRLDLCGRIWSNDRGKFTRISDGILDESVSVGGKGFVRGSGQSSLLDREEDAAVLDEP